MRYYSTKMSKIYHNMFKNTIKRLKCMSYREIHDNQMKRGVGD